MSTEEENYKTSLVNNNHHKNYFYDDYEEEDEDLEFNYEENMLYSLTLMIDYCKEKHLPLLNKNTNVFLNLLSDNDIITYKTTKN